MRRATKSAIEITRVEAILVKKYIPNMFEAIENEYKEFKAEYDADESEMQVLKDRAKILEELYNKLKKALEIK